MVVNSDHLADDPSDRAQLFAGQRPRLINLAYRLTGSLSDAEDLVADSWLRWDARAAGVRNPEAWLTTVVSRLALDHLRSARMRRESYVGPWLPEPIVTQNDGLIGTRPRDPAELVVLDDSVRMAFLVVLEELSPEQRVAFVLHDVLGLPFTQVAEALVCTEPTARQHASRARRRVADSGASLEEASGDVAAELNGLLEQLTRALTVGDVEALTELLAPDIVMLSDGAGEVFAARRPLVGAEVGRFLLGLGSRIGNEGLTVEAVLVNGLPGVLVRWPLAGPGQPAVGVYSFSQRFGRVDTVQAVLAPAKVGRYA